MIEHLKNLPDLTIKNHINPSFFYLPLCPVFKGAKEGARKGHPGCPGPSGYLKFIPP